MKSLNTILVANRGEIACRIIRTIQSEGRKAIAVFSQADADAMHVRLADAAVPIGESPANQSYLVIDNLIDAAKDAGADAIHPGYGFVSENPEMAQACRDAGITFIGPDADAIQLMGNKAEAKRHMLAAGVPCVPGYQGEDQSDAVLAAAAEELGFPIMVKAAAGGGGRGMRLVEQADALSDGLRLARAEAKSAFGNDQLILERAVIAPRHVEIQVFADKAGNTLHFGERDCSIQRRHQKIIEEAPCPVVDDALRASMGQAAVDAARSIGYVGAGTVEFLLDQDGRFYFLEMNTRLQVEHPVTELVTGIDLVALQIAIAEGHDIGLQQTDIALAGHAIEARLYAEDPDNSFMPQTGEVLLWQAPPDDLARTDAGIESGDVVSPFYDPMIAKVIAHGETRQAALSKLRTALEQMTLLGVTTNRDFLRRVLEQPAFIEGHATTAFIAEHRPSLAPTQSEIDLSHLAAAVWYLDQYEAADEIANLPEALVGWRSDGLVSSVFEYIENDTLQRVPVTMTAADTLTVGQAAATTLIIESATDHQLVATINGERVTTSALIEEQHIHLSTKTHHATFALREHGRRHDDATDSRFVYAPFHGRVTEVIVTVGQTVSRGDRVAVVEAMKMQHDVFAQRDGVVVELLTQPDAQVAADEMLIQIGDNE
ncbi:MAG: acetyl-CoA carboxylase biotin carboxylase subunit [Woeseiaceae bacterium]